MNLRSGWRLRSLLAVAALMTAATLLPAQTRTDVFKERYVPTTANVQDKGDVGVLDFYFKDPRVLTVDIPGRGRKVVWYMLYRIVNRTGGPVTFIPDFTIVTDKNTVHHDAVLPKVQEQIQQREEALGRIRYQNSVTIASTPIIPTKPESAPRSVYGVAIWDDVYDKARDATQFTIFVNGLSNGWTIDENNTVRRKTLLLPYRKHGDADSTDSSDIRYAEKPDWIYRAAGESVPGKPPVAVPGSTIAADAAPPKKDEKKDD
jgi:hypothetical protein